MITGIVCGAAVAVFGLTVIPRAAKSLPLGAVKSGALKPQDLVEEAKERLFTYIRAGAIAVATGAAGGIGDVACVAGAGSQRGGFSLSPTQVWFDMTTVAPSRSGRAPLLVDLALQGGGSHGAFTWGVLDRLLQEPWLRIEGISGTSAGAMNAAIFVDGYAEGGADGARARLELFWKQVSNGARFSPFRRSPLDVLLGRWTLDTSPIFLAFDLMAPRVPPYDLNPRGVNPLTAILAECIDFKRLSKAPIKLFVTATNVHTGRGRVFRNAEAHARCPACVGVPTNDVSGHRDRWRSLLGRRVRRQSYDHTTHSRMCVYRYDPDSGQPCGTARHPPHSPGDFLLGQRSLLQCDIAERAADDRGAPPGVRSRHQ